MNPTLIRTLKEAPPAIMAWLRRAFDATASWVTQLSWWKFFLFAILVLTAGGVMQDTLFSSESTLIVVDKKPGAARRHGIDVDSADGSEIQIDGTGIHIRKNKRPAPPEVKNGQDQAPDDSATEPSAPPATPATPGSPASPAPPVPPVPPPTGAVPGSDVHIALPPDISEEVSSAIEEAVDDAAEQKVAKYRKKSSAWFMNFVFLLVLGLFGTKALMGGKKRAEARAHAASAAAEREALLRQVSEAKMQMMQAQVEPHFLFNTLASVEHLIETDPPRASAMQRSLIKYLRAVLPQMRENAPVTNLGREADMVRAYLDLLKMRMEERLTVDFNIPDGLRSAAFPPMMLQSLVENAIKHGLEAKPEGGTLRVLAEVAHSKLRVTVADNGLGFGAIPSDGTGLGLQSIRERLKLLHADAAQLIIVPNSPSGVCATIEVPYHTVTN
jgi:signal transduction histidine kinase